MDHVQIEGHLTPEREIIILGRGTIDDCNIRYGFREHFIGCSCSGIPPSWKRPPGWGDWRSWASNGIGHTANLLRRSEFSECHMVFIGRVPFVKSVKRDIRRRSILADIRHATKYLIAPDVGCLYNMLGRILKFNMSTDRCNWNGKMCKRVKFEYSLSAQAYTYIKKFIPGTPIRFTLHPSRKDVPVWPRFLIT